MIITLANWTLKKTPFPTQSSLFTCPARTFTHFVTPSSTQPGVVNRQKNFFGGTQHPHSTPKDFSAAGEILKFIKTNIKLKLKHCVQRSKVETVFVEHQRQQRQILLGCVYRPPSAPVSSWACLFLGMSLLGHVSSWACLSDSVEVTIADQTFTKLAPVLRGDFYVNTLDRKNSHLFVTLSTSWPLSTSRIMSSNQLDMAKLQKAVFTNFAD